MQFFDANGNPLVGGKLYTYAAGTTTPQATYTSYAGTTANTNPVIFNSRGEAAVWCGDSRYYMELKDANDTLIWTADNINGANGPTLALLAASNGATLIGYTPTDNNVTTTVNNRLQLLDGVSPTATATDREYKASVNAFRDASAVAGGTVGYVNQAVYARTITGATETSFEWTNVAVMDNYSAAGENVAVYGQGNRRSTGPTWAMVAESRDFTQAANPSIGLIGIEVNSFANDTDNNFQRISVDIVAGKGVDAGAKSVTGIGLRLAPLNGDKTLAMYGKGILLYGDMTEGINISSAGTRGIYFTADAVNVVGIDLSLSTNSTSAIRIKNGDNIAFDASSLYRLRHNSTGVVGLTYSVSGADRVIISDAGGIVLSETIAWTNAYSSTTATIGTNGAPPAQVQGYITINIQGTDYKIPYYKV
jgi:hypothetical protein